MKLFVFGDYNPDFLPHLKTELCVKHYRNFYETLSHDWFSSKDAQRANAAISKYDGFFIAPGVFERPDEAYKILSVIRQSNKPVIATCGGCQSALIEYTRNVLDMPKASHEAYAGGDTDNILIRQLACSLRRMKMKIFLHGSDYINYPYGIHSAEKEYYFRFGLNPAYEMILKRGLIICARSADGGARIFAMDSHPFYVLTVFVPQLNFNARGHLLINGFFQKNFAILMLGDAFRPAEIARNRNEDPHP